jgi:hypothetical protein
MLQPLLSSPLIDRTRRNHGLEHATITVLSGRKRINLAGRSTTHGFYLYGDVRAEEVRSAAQEALRRMRGGEHDLAVHPFCGTNFVTAGFAAALAAAFGFMGARDLRGRLDRLPFVAALATLALIAAQPVGLALQRTVTTSGVMGGLEIIDVRPAGGLLPGHFVETRG